MVVGRVGHGADGLDTRTSQQRGSDVTLDGTIEVANRADNMNSRAR